jgi:protein gp37
MGAQSKIEWTDASWSPIRARNLATGKIGWHCEHVSDGCRNCYAESINRHLGTGLDFKPGHRADVEIFLDDKMLLAPLRWKKPRRIFVNSMSDTFAEFVKDEWLDRMFAVMALCPQHTFQVLTKRPERMRAYIDAVMGDQSIGVNRLGATALWTGLTGPQGPFPSWPLPNVWLGISAEDQAAADERIPLLLQTPAAVRFVSLEPLLGPIKLRETLSTDRHGEWLASGLSGEERGLNWVIVGGESGPHARPMHRRWVRDLRDQCAAAGVPFFFKQWGQHRPPTENDLAWRSLGKKRSGRLLDGAEHNGFPS